MFGKHHGALLQRKDSENLFFIVVVKRKIMLYFLAIALLTFASTFMVADAMSHIWQALTQSRVALISYGVWMAAFAVSVLDADWLTTLGFAHALFFLGCWLFVRPTGGAGSSQLEDCVQFPIISYVPAYFVLYLLQGWLW